MPEVSRLYTPPTCTLEITAQTSALSRWTRQPVVKSVQFLLSFEGSPEKSREPLEIRGDHTQLESLHEAVQAYIQTVLALPLEQSSLELDPPDVSPPHGEMFPATQGVSLRPQGLLQHELRVGALAFDLPIISLKTTQLFDLATALDAYAAELDTLPLVAASPRWQQAPPTWMRSAAAVVFLVGISAASVPLLQGLNQDLEVETARQETPPLADESYPASVAATPTSPLRVPSLEPPPPLLPSVPLPTPALPDPLPQPVLEAPPAALPLPPPVPTAAKQTDLPAPLVALPPELDLQPAAPATFERSEPFAGNRSSTAPSASDPAAMRSPESALLDVIPQVAEARQFFVERWQVPTELDQTIQYTLILNQNGSLQGIQPWGSTAEIFLDRTPMPLLNQPFVSPLSQPTPAHLRLVLGADGSVQTYMEPR
ncbi:DUF4335 domain-containing protein [Synechococcales cyanobacterium C]|uniref:DUF4335 domain-containing protein n=1 Tax=Petrachloros mirabilis ULC683 TaxID=2781853 RepID=A0A8K2A8A3_9CYAN|nr:DUF4335 domain-containing protein [Petrachloros mirabilis]NCJ06910.1 DUF4335 domain-containing protein [Petrachloros mirabilis ULC683]